MASAVEHCGDSEDVVDAGFTLNVRRDDLRHQVYASNDHIQSLSLQHRHPSALPSCGKHNLMPSICFRLPRVFIFLSFPLIPFPRSIHSRNSHPTFPLFLADRRLLLGAAPRHPFIALLLLFCVCRRRSVVRPCERGWENRKAADCCSAQSRALFLIKGEWRKMAWRSKCAWRSWRSTLDTAYCREVARYIYLDMHIVILARVTLFVSFSVKVVNQTTAMIIYWPRAGDPEHNASWHVLTLDHIPRPRSHPLVPAGKMRPYPSLVNPLRRISKASPTL
jgi:hypothetical protein